MSWHRCEHFWRWGHPCPYERLPRHDAIRDRRRDRDDIPDEEEEDEEDIDDEEPDEKPVVDIPIAVPPPVIPPARQPGIEIPKPIPIPVIPPIPVAPPIPPVIPERDPSLPPHEPEIPEEDPADIPGPEKLPVPSLVQLLIQFTDTDFAEVFEDFDPDDFRTNEWQTRTQEMISAYGIEIAHQMMQMMAVVFGSLGSLAEEQLAAVGATTGLEIDYATLGPDLITFVAGDAGAEIWEIGGAVGALIATTFIAFKAFQVIQTTIGMAGTGVRPFPAPTFRPDTPVLNPSEDTHDYSADHHNTGQAEEIPNLTPLPPEVIQDIVDEVGEIAPEVVTPEFVEDALTDAETDAQLEREQLENFYVGEGTPGAGGDLGGDVD